MSEGWPVTKTNREEGKKKLSTNAPGIPRLQASRPISETHLANQKLSVTRSHPHVHTRTRPVAQFPRPPLSPPKSKLLPFIQDYSKRGEAKIGFPENVPEEIRGSLMGAWEEV